MRRATRTFRDVNAGPKSWQPTSNAASRSEAGLRKPQSVQQAADALSADRRREALSVIRRYHAPTWGNGARPIWLIDASLRRV